MIPALQSGRDSSRRFLLQRRRRPKVTARKARSEVWFDPDGLLIGVEPTRRVVAGHDAIEPKPGLRFTLFSHVEAEAGQADKRSYAVRVLIGPIPAKPRRERG